MFSGFNDSTIKYFVLIECQNDKYTFKSNHTLYEEGIKQPCEHLFDELASFLTCLDNNLILNKRICISSPYNDARFCAGTPMKQYFYIKFKTHNSRSENIPGFFFDASRKCYKYGMNIYNMNALGMEKIRQAILDNKKTAIHLIEQFEHSNTFQLVGKSYVQDHFPNENNTIKKWLNMKTISFHHKEDINPVFFQRALLDNIINAYSEIKDLYSFVKKALDK